MRTSVAAVANIKLRVGSDAQAVLHHYPQTRCRGHRRSEHRSNGAGDVKPLGLLAFFLQGRISRALRAQGFHQRLGLNLRNQDLSAAERPEERCQCNEDQTGASIGGLPTRTQTFAPHWLDSLEKKTKRTINEMTQGFGSTFFLCCLFSLFVFFSISLSLFLFFRFFFFSL